MFGRLSSTADARGSTWNNFVLGKELALCSAWVWFNKAIGSNGDVRIWHETYLVRVGEFELAYNNMPFKGLAKIGESVPAGVELA